MRLSFVIIGNSDGLSGCSATPRRYAAAMMSRLVPILTVICVSCAEPATERLSAAVTTDGLDNPLLFDAQYYASLYQRHTDHRAAAAGRAVRQHQRQHVRRLGQLRPAARRRVDRAQRLLRLSRRRMHRARRLGRHRRPGQLLRPDPRRRHPPAQPADQWQPHRRHRGLRVPAALGPARGRRLPGHAVRHRGRRRVRQRDPGLRAAAVSQSVRRAR